MESPIKQFILQMSGNIICKYLKKLLQMLLNFVNLQVLDYQVKLLVVLQLTNKQTNK